jgi:FtsH-binding integral membrane protein
MWQVRDDTRDAAVFNFFNAVYAWMAVGLGVTAVVGYGVAHTPALVALFYGNIAIVVVFALAAFALSMYVQSQIGRISAGTATGLFLLYATIMGALTSYVFILYPAATLGTAFLLTAGTFGAMSVYGFVTKRDLTGIGSMAIMLVFGFIIASLVNLFLQSSALGWLITYGILVLFVIITAYETQMLKRMAEQFRGNPAMAQRVAVVGSLVLYISFLNMFLSILRILGDRR